MPKSKRNPKRPLKKAPKKKKPTNVHPLHPMHASNTNTLVSALHQSNDEVKVVSSFGTFTDMNEYFKKVDEWVNHQDPESLVIDALADRIATRGFCDLTLPEQHYWSLTLMLDTGPYMLDETDVVGGRESLEGAAPALRAIGEMNLAAEYEGLIDSAKHLTDHDGYNTRIGDFLTDHSHHLSVQLRAYGIENGLLEDSFS